MIKKFNTASPLPGYIDGVTRQTCRVGGGGDRGAGDREKRGREVYGRREKRGREAGEKGKN